MLAPTGSGATLPEQRSIATQSCFLFIAAVHHVEKKVAVRSKMIYSISVVLPIMKFDKILLIGGLVVAASLVLKSIKQFIYLSFTLLTLKFVWIVIIVLFVLMSLKKKTRSSREIKK